MPNNKTDEEYAEHLRIGSVLAKHLEDAGVTVITYEIANDILVEGSLSRILDVFARHGADWAGLEFGTVEMPHGEPDIQAIAAREVAASAGPWRDENGSIYSDARAIAEGGDEMGAQFTVEDGAFVAHARTDIPLLLAALARVTAERDALRG